MRRWLKRIVVGLVVFVAPVVLGYFLFVKWAGERELDAAIARLDAAGEPWRMEDLIAALPPIPAEQNSSTHIRRITPLVPRSFSSKKLFDQIGERPSNFGLHLEDFETFMEEMEQHAAILKEVDEQIEFFWREVNFLRPDEDFVGGKIKEEIPLAEQAGCLLRVGRQAPQGRAHTRQQFINPKRFGDVIICSRIQGFDFALLLALNGKHDDGDLRGFANGLTQGQPTHFRHGKVSDDQRWMPIVK